MTSREEYVSYVFVSIVALWYLFHLVRWLGRDIWAIKVAKTKSVDKVFKVWGAVSLAAELIAAYFIDQWIWG